MVKGICTGEVVYFITNFLGRIALHSTLALLLLIILKNCYATHSIIDMKTQSGQIHKGRLVSVTDLVEIAGRLKASTVAVPGGHRKEDLQLVESARDHGIVDRIMLVGDKMLISRAVTDVGINIPERDIIPVSKDEQIADATIDLIKKGLVDIVLKGGISTPIINRRMLQVAIRPTVSLASIFDAAPISGGRPVILTDAGMTTVCNFGRLVGIIENAVEVAKVVMGIASPRVAVLSANEKQIPSLPSTGVGKKLTERSWSGCVVYGPLSLDLATDPDSVAVKGIPDIPAAREVAGRADILVCPGIDAANILYKAITAMTKFGQASIAGITIGFQVPYVILSRADTLETRMNSIALCSVYAQRRKGLHRKSRSPLKRTGSGFRILALYPDVSSIRVALFENETLRHEGTISHESNTVRNSSKKDDLIAEISGRIEKKVIGWKPGTIDALAVPGGFLPSHKERLSSGTYVLAEARNDSIVVDQDLLAFLAKQHGRAHVTNIGALAAARLAKKLNVQAYMIDLNSAGELFGGGEACELYPEASQSTAQAIGIGEAAKRAADAIGRSLGEISLIVVRIGDEVTAVSFKHGSIIDVDRITELKLPSETQSSNDELRMDMIDKNLETGDRREGLVFDLLINGIVKKIGALYAGSGADIEAIVLTGELVKNVRIRDSLRHRISPLAPVIVMEGSLEMEALASGAVEVLSGEHKPRRFRKG
jgi:phosphate butyryltransferase